MVPELFDSGDLLRCIFCGSYDKSQCADCFKPPRLFVGKSKANLEKSLSNLIMSSDKASNTEVSLMKTAKKVKKSVRDTSVTSNKSNKTLRSLRESSLLQTPCEKVSEKLKKSDLESYIEAQT